MELSVKLIGIAALFMAFGSEALTLGRARGAALIGQPLDMVIPVQLDAAEDAPALCFEADVFYADNRQDAGRVRVLVEPLTQAKTANVRVLSSNLIDEPVVTIYLRTGCGQKNTRRYVLLAEPAAESAAPPVALAVVAPERAGLPAVNSAPSDGLSRAASLAAAVPKSVRPARVLPTTQRPTPPVAVSKAVEPVKQTVATEEAKPVKVAAQSRLILDPLDSLSDRIANLDASVASSAESSWQDPRKMTALEAEVKTLMAAAVKNEASLLDLKTRLQRSESEQFSSGFVYGLIALVLASLAALALLWRRQRHATGLDDEDWRVGAMTAPLPAADASEMGLGDGLAATPTFRDGKFAFSRARPESAVDVNVMEMSESNFEEFLQSRLTDSAFPKVPVTAPVAALPEETHAELVSNFSSDEVLDVRQQAEFFVSLGDIDQAVHVLEKQINESDSPNPLIYLDLLSILHARGQKIEFQQFRQEFNLWFNGKIPEFSAFKNEGNGLEAYPDILAKITSLWPNLKVIELIKVCIFRNTQEHKSNSFDLAAFRELLLLYAVAQVVARDNGKPDSVLPVLPVVPEFNASEDPILNNIDFPGLDLDLSEDPAGKPVATQPLKPDAGAHWSVENGNLLNFELHTPFKPK